MKSDFLFGVSALVILLMVLGSEAQGAWNPDTLANKLKAVSPAAGIQKLEIIKSDSGNLLGVAAHYQGGPLPGDRSIVLELDPPEARRVSASNRMATDPYWTEPFWTDSLGKLNPLTQFALWQEPDGKFGVMIALVGGGMVSRIEGAGAKVIIYAESKDSKFAPSKAPMFAIGWGDDPYKLVDDIYAFGFKVMKQADAQGVIGDLRVNKPFPEIFKYLGWCSWNAYYTAVNEKKLIESANSFKKLGLPIRWFIIDDRWMAVAQTVPVANPGRKQSITQFEADPEKFPNGLAHATKILKQDYGISWIGVWLTFQGYWNGVAVDSELGRDYKDALMQVSDQAAIPDPRGNAGEKFWDGWFGFLKKAGVDFVKVDNQSDLGSYFHGALPVNTGLANSHRNLEGPAEKHFNLNLIDCMEMNVDTIYQWTRTNIGRASGDFYPAKYSDPRRHTVNGFLNALWLSELLYPDHDMWMTHDSYAIYHAVDRALSGGPVYITDKPGVEKPELVWPLILSDGTVIRPDAPGLPALQSIFEDPYVSGKPFVAFARSGDSGVLGAWNVDRKYHPVTAELSASDIYGIKGDRFAIYDYFSGKVSALGRTEKFTVKMGIWDVRLYSVVPIQDGFAPIGLINKYISPATIGAVKREPGKVSVELNDAGTFAAYSEQKPKQVKLNGSLLSDQLMEYSGNLLTVKIVQLSDGRPKVQLEFFR